MKSSDDNLCNQCGPRSGLTKCRSYFLNKLILIKKKVSRRQQYSKTCLKGPLSKRPKIVFQDQLSLNAGSLNAGQMYCRMLKEEHSAILLTFIKLPFVIKSFVLFIFEWPLKTDFTVA